LETQATQSTGREQAILVGLELTRKSKLASQDVDPGESLAELAVLAASAGAHVIDSLLQKRPGIDAATLIGAGKVEEIRELAEAAKADVVIFDHDLTPTQLRNLEKALGTKVLDRTQLILDIFAARARTSEGKLQVELAQLNYLLPRLSGHGASMSRLGGGIGTRGPGETKLETDRRRIYTRIQKLERSLETVRGSRGIQRRQRQSVPLATVALAGYTNAGKSTLFNRLTGASVLADARMFATLDPTVRKLSLPSKRAVLLSDTVGFIRSLPTALVKAFRATLEEVTEAALILHVVDASSPVAEDNVRHVEEVLREIGATDTPTILVLNKVDQLGASDLPPMALAARMAPGLPAVGVSGKTGQGLAELAALIDEHLALDRTERATFRFPASEAGQLHWLEAHARILKTDFDDSGWTIEADVPASIRRRLKNFELR
jgi:GTP-binding protein HflX